MELYISHPTRTTGAAFADADAHEPKIHGACARHLFLRIPSVTSLLLVSCVFHQETPTVVVTAPGIATPLQQQ